MPVALTYPGVYVEEVPSGVRPLTGVATSVTGFVGAATRGPVETPVSISSFTEYERRFGGLSRSSPMSYAVAQFYANGGGEAIIVRVVGADAAAAKGKAGSSKKLSLIAAARGSWGNDLQARVTADTRPPAPGETLFNLLLRDKATGTIERFLNVSPSPAHPRFVGAVLAAESTLARLDGAAPTQAPAASTGADADFDVEDAWASFTEGAPGGAINAAAVAPGLAALAGVDLLNLLVVPPYAFDANGDRTDIDGTTRDAALKIATDKRAIFIADAPFAWKDGAAAAAPDALATLNLSASANGAIYFPGILAPDPLREGRIAEFAPAGAVAGAIARTDGARGVWKAPAGLEAGLAGVSGPAIRLTDAEQGRLNPRGINVVRAFPNVGTVIWGARTLRGADVLASEWKYLPVRRLALFLEESLFRGTQWVVFEPNDEPLWAQIRLNIGAFMQGLFRQGAFAGASPREAYLVKCDRETTTAADVNAGVVNIVVGFAPLKPAEFVVLKIQQLAGQQA
ncbi:phage tail sheath subtilisin-like domain-containing protein [Sphingomonas sp. 1P06PA]|uniref:phage tail sheath family protein n=1 Tax=Sphingomonas sp. 1P06PA TaxID=554121 RepID=UPI0039A50B66